MKHFYVTFRHISILRYHYVIIQAFDIANARRTANAIFKHVDMITYEPKFYKGDLHHFTTINADNYLK